MTAAASALRIEALMRFLQGSIIRQACNFSWHFVGSCSLGRGPAKEKGQLWAETSGSQFVQHFGRSFAGAEGASFPRDQAHSA